MIFWDMPNLKTCAINQVIPQSSEVGNIPVSTNTVSNMLKWLLQGMPAIESFTFGHGDTGLTSFPGIGNGLEHCPKTLRKLCLRELNIEPTALSSSSIDLDVIESITLENCGDNQIESLKRFCRRYQGRPNTPFPSLGVCGNLVYMVRGDLSLPSDAVEIDFD